MILLDRWTEIVNYLRNRKFATVEELMNEFNISRSTLRRDLIAMEERKLIVRTRGGAQIVEDAEDNYANYSLDNILNTHKEEKIKITNQKEYGMNSMIKM